MGLQYFEALSPATVASIVAVLSNRLVTGNDVTGYFSYPFLTSSLPSSIFIYAIVYGFYGCLIGTLYTHGAKLFKTIVQHCLHAPQQHHNEFKAQDKSDNDFALANGSEESVPLVAKRIKKQSSDKNSVWNCVRSYFCFVIPHKPKRAAVAGTLAGAMVGVIGIFVPHVLFYGEAQLQNLIDKGRTPLPIFGDAKDLSAYAYCLIDAENNEEIRAGFSIACSSLIMVAKTVVIGLSLGTGIIGGQFWGPLCVGCAASHLLTDVVELFHSRFGFGHGLAAHPCVVILCTMGAAHVGKCRTL